MVHSHNENKRKKRTFTRAEMIDFTRGKLIEANEGIEFVTQKHNVLTCRYRGETISVYISSSRDYSTFDEGMDYKPNRLKAWNKGSQNIFKSYDYYALLVKADEKTQYVTEKKGNIEGIFVSREEMNSWMSNKVKVPSGMVNFYLHYSQLPDESGSFVNVIDDREELAISLNPLYKKGWTIR
ncbi:hypothetical protein LCM10_18585 [Rossellomorea aquimaris]|uniref:hypothetical protein n=1 Tax=Rossellomorea aquimaris TaxID=189382 RepID=UPI001CD3E088|nr:hypothetical protein [Rossellomorea aquimaris]MCA1056974.1 hypothetical protein [Rossellomorea aquimaris]